MAASAADRGSLRWAADGRTRFVPGTAAEPEAVIEHACSGDLDALVRHGFSHPEVAR